MTTTEEKRAAHALLDMARAGGRLSRETIVAALVILGDIVLDLDDDDPVIHRHLGIGEWELEHARHAAPATWCCGLFQPAAI